jgi:UDP-N-acetylmuramoyl-tripeptide--D-alanyl-D-alanine ligase
VRAALDLLGHTTGTKIAVLGDMLELGPLEESSHREVGARVAEVADWLVARGPRTRWIAEEAQRRGMRPERVRFAASNREAAEIAREIMEEGTAGGSVAILVKGSRGLRMEEVVDDLRTGVGV